MAFQGVFSTPMTPFDERGRLALDRIDPFLEWQAKAGISGIYVLGTWGGFATMSVEERRKACAAFCAAARRYELKSIVHIGTYAEHEAVDLARHAVDQGADAISSLLPQYYSTGEYLRIDDYRRYFARLVEATDAPLYLYNNPRTTAVLVEPEDFVELAKVGVAGVKDGSKNVAWIIKAQQYLKEQGQSAAIIPGNTVGLVYGKMYGCAAATSGAAVVFPRETVEVHRRIDLGDIAGAVAQHRFVLELRSAIGRSPAPPAAAHGLLSNSGPDLGRPRGVWPEVKGEALAAIEGAIEYAYQRYGHSSDRLQGYSPARRDFDH